MTDTAGYGILRETTMAVYEDLRDRNRQTRLTASWLLAVCALAMGYAWNAGEDENGFYLAAAVFFMSLLGFLMAMYPRKSWALARDAGVIYRKRRDALTFTAADADKAILEALLADKGKGKNILMSLYNDTHWRTRFLKAGMCAFVVALVLVAVIEAVT